MADLRILDGGGDGEQPIFPDRTDGGKPRGTYRNARIALTCFGARFAYNAFADRAVIEWPMLDSWDGKLADAVVDRFRGAIIAKYGFDPKKENTADALASLCWENTFDPVKDYLDALKWDGKPRLTDWLRDYMGAGDGRFTRAVARKTLIAAVRRVRSPGCKFDNVLILEGGQGTGKSSALRILAGLEDAFTDQDMLHLDMKMQKEALAGKWIVELAELAGMRRADAERVKAFVSRTHDRARAAYARFTDDQPRRCVMIGTTNAEEYLSDPTGNRRFWPVRTGEIDLEKLRLDRDQLWAEAAVLEASGESLFLDADLWPVAAAHADARMQADPWEEALRKIKGDIRAGSDGAEETIMTAELLSDKLSIPRHQQTTAAMQRLATVMRRLGWKPDRISTGKTRARGYARPLTEDHDD